MTVADRPWSHPALVNLVLRDQAFQVKPWMDLREALQKISVASESVLAMRNGELISEDTLLHPGDQVRLVHVISGG